ncbi:MAG TPA: hypothetical protein VGU74_06050 [Gemmatimonadales bacterium]|nr:hypothetical protein [Gemmatimonadales bacterium]
MGRKVRKTLNIDAEKLKRAREYLELDTETEVIDRLLDDCEFERELEALNREFRPFLRTFRSPLVTRAPHRRGGRRK